MSSISIKLRYLFSIQIKIIFIFGQCTFTCAVYPELPCFPVQIKANICSAQLDYFLCFFFNKKKQKLFTFMSAYCITGHIYTAECIINKALYERTRAYGIVQHCSDKILSNWKYILQFICSFSIQHHVKISFSDIKPQKKYIMSGDL